MADYNHTTTTTSTSPLPAPLPSLKDAFKVRREIFSAEDDEPVDTLVGFTPRNLTLRISEVYVFGVIVIAATVLPWFLWVF